MALFLDRGLALWRSIKRGNSESRNAAARKEMAEQITGDVRDALTTAQYNIEDSLRGFMDDLRDRDDAQRDRDDAVRREIMMAIAAIPGKHK